MTKGLFITGTNTGVGKTYVAALIARALVASGRRVGVYKPVASGCRVEENRLVAEDAVALWEAAGRPDELNRVAPRRFAAPIAPHLAARAEETSVDAELLRRGIDDWRQRSDIVLVEGARRADVANQRRRLQRRSGRRVWFSTDCRRPICWGQSIRRSKHSSRPPRSARGCRSRASCSMIFHPCRTTALPRTPPRSETAASRPS